MPRPLLALISLTCAVLAGCGLGTAVMTAAHAQTASNRANAALLVARPELPDPNFAQTVVLVTQATDGHTVGVILNRPTSIAAAEFFAPEVDTSRYRDAIYFGGPVMRQIPIAVFESKAAPPAAAFHVLPDVYLSMHPDNVLPLLSGDSGRYRLYAGFSGWAPGQLDNEFAREGWLILPATADLIFRRDVSGLWEELIARAAGERAEGPQLPHTASRSVRTARAR